MRSETPSPQPSATAKVTSGATSTTTQKPTPFSSSEQDRIRQAQPWVQQASDTYALDADLINGVIWVESRFEPRAKSPAGARGLMQLMPATAHAMARDMGHRRARVDDPKFNVMAGSHYLARLIKRYDGDERLALAAYQAGAGNVQRWLAEDGDLPPRSQRYVDKVEQARARFASYRTDALPARIEPPTELAVAQRTTSTPKAHKPAIHNPLAPEPGVYHPTPPLEPPLVDTPYLPMDEDRRQARLIEPARPKPILPSQEPILPGHRRAHELPSVLD